ncbi:histidine kinase [Amycolatopsis sp. NBRC 101858]|uniref:HAMP domain-containing sensor histidine kinase n=1 Tax=Amycolatopsis sp. NBRC 101858 TaxID=3032200 RepID=UPI0024A1392D|nr:sensor histidine kinase [Amycolatopsis sp. NBRC 101858]GLY38066.1 histidine kinase [Amycolatopsis sp. NBRC 101858]
MPLYRRIFLLNAVVLSAATALLLLGPVTVSAPALFTEVVILVGGLAVVLVANAVLLRIGLAPLHRLSRTMTTIDLLRPAPRLTPRGRDEVAELIRTFNAMLDRLETERGFSAARALSVQEAERSRIARELHDEVGQSLTAVLLDLKRVSNSLPAATREELRSAQETTRSTLDEIRRIARRLRPGVLEELGLTSSLTALSTEITEHSDLTVLRRFDHAVPHLGDEIELVLYRVAQESLTNAVRHARALHAEVVLRTTVGQVELRVRDDGRGLGDAAEGAGITGMRERALLVGGRLTVGPAPGSGTEVRLVVPLDGADR